MPLDRRTEVRRLEVDLRAVQPHARRTEQLLEDGDEPGRLGDLPKQPVIGVRRLDAANPRRLRPVAGLEIVDLVVLSDLAAPATNSAMTWRAWDSAALSSISSTTSQPVSRYWSIFPW